MLASWIFKPKYGIDIVRKVVDCFATSYLDWQHNGVEWSFYPASKEGWYSMDVALDTGACEYYSEVCFSDSPVSATDMADGMLVLLIEAGVAYKHDEDDENSNSYYLEDIDIAEVLGALSETGTNVYSPAGSRCYIYPVGDSAKTPHHVDMLDALLTLEAA